MALLDRAREVLVRIRGQEDVTAASRKADSSLAALGKRAVAIGVPVAAAAAVVVKGVLEATEAAEEFNASQRKLEATAKITGVSLDTLAGISQRGKDGFKLSSLLANEYAVELSKLASKAGDVGKAAPGMEAFLDLGAARGLSAADTLKAVQQSILGIDEGTDKLFGKNPSAIYAEFAAQIGSSAAKLSDQQKAQALLNAAMEDGGKVRGEYATYLQSTAGQQEQFSQALRQAAAELGNAFSPVLRAIIPFMTSWVQWLAKGVQAVRVFAIDTAYHFDQVPNVVALVKGRVLEQLGELLQTAGHFVPFFGGKVKALGDELLKEGQRQVKASEATTRQLQAARQAAEDDILGVVRQSGAAQVVETRKTGAAVTTVTAEEGKKRRDQEEKDAKALAEAREKWNRDSLAQLKALGAWLGEEREKQGKAAGESAERLARQLNVNLGEASAKALDLTTAAMERLLVQLRGNIPVEQWQALDVAIRQHKTSLADLLPPTDALAESVREAKEYNQAFAAATKETKPDVARVAQDAATLARGVLDAAQAAGILSSNMGSALTSVINIASALPKALQGDASSIVAVVGGLANVITGLADNPAEKLRREVLMKNSDAIARLTREVGNFNLGTSGRTFQGLTEVFGGFEGRAAKLSQGSASERQAGALVLQRDLLKALAARGLSQKDAEELFNQIGAPELAKIFTTKDSSLILALVPQIIAALGNTEFGTFGQDFEGQLQALTEGFGILGITDDDDKLRQFVELAGKFSPALKEALAGDLSTPEGRAQATKNLQALFQKLKTPGALSPSEIGVSGPQLLSLLNAILPLLAGANGVAGNGLPVTGPQTTGTTSTGALYRVPPIEGLGTFGLGAPSITGAIAQVPTSSTTINGGFVLNQYFPDVTDPELAAERAAEAVAAVLGRDYVRQRIALGLGTP